MSDIQAYDAMSKEEQTAYDAKERQREKEEQASGISTHPQFTTDMSRFTIQVESRPEYRYYNSSSASWDKREGLCGEHGEEEAQGVIAILLAMLADVTVRCRSKGARKLSWMESCLMRYRKMTRHGLSVS
jgi:hypothetical protein